MPHKLPKHVPISANKCKSILEKFLIGSCIVRIEYFRAAWEISFLVADDRQSSLNGVLGHPFEVILEAHEIVPPDLGAWQSALAATPTDVISLPGHHNAVTALILFNAVAYKVVGIGMCGSSTIEIEFEGDRKLLVAGICNPFDEVWTLAPQSFGKKRDFGGPAYVQSYFGDLSADPRVV